MSLATLLAIITALGLGTPITILLTKILNRKKDRTDAASVVQGMAIGVAEEIRAQLQDARTQMAALEKKVATAEDQIKVLNASLAKALERAQDAEDERDKLLAARTT